MSALRSNPTPSGVEPWNVPITPKVVKQVSIVCFIAWVASVYDFTLFGTLLPVIAEDFGCAAVSAGSEMVAAQVALARDDPESALSTGRSAELLNMPLLDFIRGN